MGISIGGGYDQFGKGKIFEAKASAQVVSSAEYQPFNVKLFDECDSMVIDSVGTRKRIEKAGIQFKTIFEKFTKEGSVNGEKIEKNGCSVQYNITELKNKQYIFEAVYITPTGKLVKRYNTQTKTTQSEHWENGVRDEIIESKFKPQEGSFYQRFLYPHGGKAKTVKFQKIKKEPNFSRDTTKTITKGEMTNARGEVILRAFDDQSSPDKYASYRELSLFAKAPDNSGKRLEFKTVAVYNSDKKRDGGELRIKDNNGKEWIFPMYEVTNKAALNKYFKKQGDYTVLKDDEGTGVFVPYKNVADLDTAFKIGFNCNKDQFIKFYEKVTSAKPPKNVGSGNMENYYKDFEALYEKL